MPENRIGTTQKIVVYCFKIREQGEQRQTKRLVIPETKPHPSMNFAVPHTMPTWKDKGKVVRSRKVLSLCHQITTKVSNISRNDLNIWKLVNDRQNWIRCPWVSRRRTRFTWTRILTRSQCWSPTGSINRLLVKNRMLVEINEWTTRRKRRQWGRRPHWAIRAAATVTK